MASAFIEGLLLGIFVCGYIGLLYLINERANERRDFMSKNRGNFYLELTSIPGVADTNSKVDSKKNIEKLMKDIESGKVEFIDGYKSETIGYWWTQPLVKYNCKNIARFTMKEVV